MPTTIAHTSIETVSRLLRNEFDNLDNIQRLCGEDDRIIKAARDYGFAELATEMENDLKQL